MFDFRDMLGGADGYVEDIPKLAAWVRANVATDDRLSPKARSKIVALCRAAEFLSE